MSMHKSARIAAVALAFAIAAVDLALAQSGQGTWSKAAPMSGVPASCKP